MSGFGFKHLVLNLLSLGFVCRLPPPMESGNCNNVQTTIKTSSVKFGALCASNNYWHYQAVGVLPDTWLLTFRNGRLGRPLPTTADGLSTLYTLLYRLVQIKFYSLQYVPDCSFKPDLYFSDTERKRHASHVLVENMLLLTSDTLLDAKA